MKIRRDAGKKLRINYGFFGMVVEEPGNWWYNRDLRRWELEPKHDWNNYATWQPCHSVRAFRRLLKDAPHGIRFKLESVWKGKDVYGTGSGEQAKSKSETMLEQLKTYLETTPRDQILADWAKTEKYDKVGPTVDQFMTCTKRMIRQRRIGRQVCKRIQKRQG
jgi:hypothetical protein